MDRVQYVRLLRTPSSERFLLRRSGQDIAALDLHYLATGNVTGTLIVFEGAGVADADAGDLLTDIDEVLLPEVSLDTGKLTFTLVVGRVLGAFEPAAS